MYELKEECYAMYNPFFFHYTRTEQSKVGRVEGGSGWGREWLGREV